jgi:hypothetical protein
VCKYEGEGYSRTWHSTPRRSGALQLLQTHAITNIENGPHKEGTIGNWSRALGSSGKMWELDAVFGSWNPHPGRRCMYTIHIISLFSSPLMHACS